MKWWYWLILELLIIFGVIAWIYFFPSEIEYDFAKGMVGFALICAIENCKDIKQEEIKMKKIKGYNIVKEKTNELLVSIEIGNDEVIERNGYKVIPFYEEGNPTIEQNAGENRIEGGDEACTKISLNKGIDRQYRPFNNCDELIEVFREKCEAEVNCSTFFPKLYKACIWVKHKEYGTENLITAFDNDNESIGGSCVFIQDIWVDMKELLDNFSFLDGSPCGKEE